MLNFFNPIVALLLQEASRTRFDLMREAAANPDLSKFLVIGGLRVVIGVAGVLTRRNIIVIFMSIELILNAANLNFIAFSRYLHEMGSPNALTGQIFAVFVLVG